MKELASFQTNKRKNKETRSSCMHLLILFANMSNVSADARQTYHDFRTHTTSMFPLMHLARKYSLHLS